MSTVTASIPLMMLGVAFAVVPVLWGSLRCERDGRAGVASLPDGVTSARGNGLSGVPAKEPARSNRAIPRRTRRQSPTARVGRSQGSARFEPAVREGNIRPKSEQVSRK